MAYALDFSLALGGGNTGLTLSAQLVDTGGANVGSLITTGFVEIGGGNYLWHTAAIPDSHRGGVIFKSGSTVKAFAAINPQEAENTDVKTSTRSSHTAADVWASGTRTLTSFGTLVADVAAAVWASATRTLTSAAGLTAADVWSYVTRTLTMSAAQVTAALQGSNILAIRGDSLAVSLTGLGSLTGRTKLYVTVKLRENQPDTAAILQWEESAGLLRLNGAAATSSQGTLTVNDANSGNLTLTLTPAATAQLAPQAAEYDVQKITGATVTTMTFGVFAVLPDVTEALS